MITLKGRVEQIDEMEGERDAVDSFGAPHSPGTVFQNGRIVSPGGGSSFQWHRVLRTDTSYSTL
jgi:hypothetical protein